MRFVMQLTLIALLCNPLFAQTTAQDAHVQSSTCGVQHLDRCVVDIAKDQAGIFSSPFRANPNDLKWIVPFAAATAVSVHYDADALRELGHDSSRERTSRHISDICGIYAPIAGSLGMYVLGSTTHNDHLRETGLLSGEALIDATIVTSVVKLATQRERPDDGTGEGRFWPHGTNGFKGGTSFPSGHSAAAWSVAHVIADEYPGWLTKLGVYGLATTVSATRVTARKHFPSDVVVGSVFGYLIGGYVYHHRATDSADRGSLLVEPVYDGRSRSYGLMVEFDPHLHRKHAAVQ